MAPTDRKFSFESATDLSSNGPTYPRTVQARNTTSPEAQRISILENEISRLNAIVQSTIQAAQPPLRHLASSTPNSSRASSLYGSRVYSRRRVDRSISLSDQRHPGKPGTFLGRIVATPDASDDENDHEQRNLSGKSNEAGSSGDALPIFAEIRSTSPGNKNEKQVGFSTTRAHQESELVDHEIVYPEGLVLALIIAGLCLAVFLVSLDRTIITTAIPQITAQFLSYDDVGWYGSGYLLTACAFQPLYGRIFQMFNIKWSFMVALGIFELGSLICAVAPSSTVLILGRAIAGVGSAGLLTGAFVVVTHSVSLQKRPIYTAAIGLTYGLGTVTGPLLGGVFTDTLSWRWCFWINLPCGGATFLAMVFLFKPLSTVSDAPIPFLARVFSLDLVGNAILLCSAVMLFLALQFTEVHYAWSSAMVVGLLVGAGVTFLIFCVWQIKLGERALMPPRIIKMRNVTAGCLIGFFIFAAMLVHSYYLPQWFQAVKGESAISSGVDMIPYMAANALFNIFAGVLVSKTGYYTPPAILGGFIGTIGCGVLTTLTPSSGTGTWIGFQILISAGFGMTIQQGFNAIQTTLPLEEVPIATAAVVACQSLGGAIFISVGNTILQGSLLSNGRTLPGVDIQAVIDAGAAQFRSIVPAEALPPLLEVYNDALRKVFVVAIPLAGLTFFSSLLFDWTSMKGKANSKEGEDSA